MLVLGPLFRASPGLALEPLLGQEDTKATKGHSTGAIRERRQSPHSGEAQGIQIGLLSLQFMRNPIWLEQCHCADSLVSFHHEVLPPFLLLICYFSAGDIVDAMFALLVVKTCSNIDGDLPAQLRGRMLMNVVIDFVIGLVPFVGDIADAVYKCNSRNAVILEGHLRKKGMQAIKDQKRQQEPNLDMSLPEEFDRYEHAGDTQESGTVTNATPATPEPAKQPQRGRSQKSQRSRSQKRTNSQRGWLGGSKTKEDDVERGVV